MDDAKPEWPPLLNPGFWPMTLAELRVLCVDQFPLSKIRPTIMQGLETVVHALDRHNITADVWVDGSFLTLKIEPGDVDLILSFDGDVYDKGSAAQKAVMDAFNDDTRLGQFYCHGYIVPMYPNSNDPKLLGWAEWNRSYWISKFGISRGNDEHGNKVNDGVFKGMALIKTPFQSVGGANP